MNRSTKTIVSNIGVILGLSGIDHGIFEILQGNQPTNGALIQAIEPAQKMWEFCWALVFGGGCGLFLLSIISGFANDIQCNWENV